jgi:hypothetical protein
LHKTKLRCQLFSPFNYIQKIFSNPHHYVSAVYLSSSLQIPCDIHQLW